MKTPIFNIHDLILLLTLAVCILLVIFQWVLSKQTAIASRFLSVFFVCVGISALCNLLLWSDHIHLQTDYAKMLLSLGLVTAVVGKSLSLYFYVVSITRTNFSVQLKDTLHLLHLPVAFSFIIWGNLNSDNLRFFVGPHTENSVAMTNYLWHYLKCMPMIYAFAAVLEIRRYKRDLKEFYSSLQLEGPYWLLLLTLGFAINWLWSLLVHLLGQNVSLNIADSFGIFDNYITFLLVNALFIYSLLYAHQLLETRSKLKEKEAPVAEVSPQSINRIRDAMEKQQLYLKPNLNIEEFARHVGIHYREVSSIINKHFNTNFFEFVNEYRVSKAKQTLIDPDCAQMTILDILLESGFNSKSSFHRFFKRYVGMSAADFRKKSFENLTPS